MSPQIKKIYPKLEKTFCDGLLLSSPANISYLADFTSRDAYLLISKKEKFYITDSRYTEEVKRNLAKIFTIKKINGSVFRLIAQLSRNLGLKKVAFEERYLLLQNTQK